MPGNFDKWEKFARPAAMSWTLLVLVILAFCDTTLSSMMENSDYLSCIYTGAKLFAAHRWDDLYLKAGAVTFANQPCDIYAHQILPHLNKHYMADFNYSPLVAYVVTPLTLLAPNLSMIAWHLLSLACLGAAVYFLAAPGKRLDAFCYSFLFLPVPIAIWIGQLDLVFGVFFFALGYKLLCDNRPTLSALAFAAACMKPQLVVLPAFIALVELLSKRFRFAFTLAAGLALLVAANIAVGSSDLFRHWLWHVGQCERIFMDPKGGVSTILMLSVPGTILHALPQSWIGWGKPLVYLLVMAVLALSALLAARFRRACADRWLPYTCALGILLLPISLPSFMYYDFCLMVLLALLLLAPECQALSGGSKILLGELATANIYGIILLAAKPLAYPPLFLLPLIGAYVFWLRHGFRQCKIG